MTDLIESAGAPIITIMVDFTITAEAHTVSVIKFRKRGENITKSGTTHIMSNIIAIILNGVDTIRSILSNPQGAKIGGIELQTEKCGICIEVVKDRANIFLLFIEGSKEDQNARAKSNPEPYD